MSYYQITLLVTTEQENAIFDLFQERQWIYIKTGHIQTDDAFLCEFKDKLLPASGHVPADRYSQDSEIRTSSENFDLHSDIEPLNHDENSPIETADHCEVIVKKEPVLSDENEEALLETGYNEPEAQTSSSVITPEPVSAESIESLEVSSEKLASNKKLGKRKHQKQRFTAAIKRRNKLGSVEKQKHKLIINTAPFVEKGLGKNMLSSNNATFSSKKDDDENSKVKEQDGSRSARGLSKLKIFCDQCNRTFSGRKRYENHMIDGKCYWECEYCGKTFHHRNKTSYEVHLKLHRNEYDFKCDECGMAFATKGNLVRHQQARHASDRPHRCDFCSYRFHTKTSLLRHIERKHTKGDGINRCPECSKTFSLPSELQVHLETQHVDLPCNICGKVVRRTYIWRHELTHKESRDFKCDHCPAAFKARSDLLRHKRRHTKEYSDYCEVCGKGFYALSPLKIHKRTHTGEKPYACSLCDYRCALKGNLKLHMKVHEKAVQ